MRRPATAAAMLGIVALGGGQLVAAPPLDAPAVASIPAVRAAPTDPSGECDLATVEALAARHPQVEQFVLTLVDDFTTSSGTTEVVVRIGGRWQCQLGPVESRLGRNGTRPLPDRRSGDGTTPAGVFGLGTVTAWDGQELQFFGNRPDPGVRGAYREVRPEDCWGATPGEPTYQQLFARPNCPGPDDEWLPRYGDVYGHAAIIGANLDPVSGDQPGEPALAAAIFLHRHSYTTGGSTSGPTRPTAGCVSVAMTELVTILRLLDPDRDPHFAIGSADWLRDHG